MHFHRVAPAGIAALLAAGSLGAQTSPRPGTVEVGAFGQYTVQADTFAIDNTPGFGARVGAFFLPNWQLEGEFSYGKADFNGSLPSGVSTPSIGYSTLAARINYNFPLAVGANSAVILGAGVVRSNYKQDEKRGASTFAYGASGLLGLRYGFTPQFALRVDVLPEYHPSPEAFNITARAGLSYLLMGGAPVPEADMAMAGALHQPGTLETGLFANFPILASGWNLKNALGFGARAGVFITPRWQVEGEFAYSESDVDDANALGEYDTPLTKDSYNYVPQAARLNYNIPFGTRTSFVVGGGAVRSHYEYTYNYGASGLAGIRFALGNRAAIRADVVGNYMPEPSSFDAIDSAAIRDSLARAAAEGARNAVLAQIFFGFDRSDINDSARTTLDAKVPILQANPEMRIRISGHADPRGSDEYNLALGQRRANAARRYLVQRGVTASRITTVSYGEERPACSEANEDCYARDRRNEFEIIAGGENITVPAGQGQQPPDER